MNIIVYGKKRQVVGYYQDPEHDGYLRLLLDGGQAYVYAVANCNSHYEKMLVEAPTEIQEAPDGNGDTLIYADGTQARTGGGIMPFTKADAEYVTVTAMQQADAAPANSKPKTKQRQAVTQSDRTEWTLQALEKVAAIWVAWRRNHNTQTMGGRERDCFEKHKDTLPVCIKTAKDFQNCKECARKHGLIPKHNRKRRKSAG